MLFFKYSFPIIFLFFSFIQVYSQSVIKGQVINATTGAGIDCAVVRIENSPYGCYTDSAGQFVIPFSNKRPDSLLVSCLGFYSKKIKCDNSNLINKVYLSIRIHNLGEVSVKPMTKIKILDSNSKKNDGVSMASNDIFTRFFSVDYTPSKFSSFYFYVCKKCSKKTKMRVCLFSCDKSTKRPYEDLMPSNIILENIKCGWNKVDLLKFEIPVPPDGFYIGIESLTRKENCMKMTHKEKDTTRVYFTDIVLGTTIQKIKWAAKYSKLDISINGERLNCFPEGWSVPSNLNFAPRFKLELVY